MRTLLLAIFATLLLAAPASAARFQHNGADIEFTTAVNDTVRITATGHQLGDPKQLTFTRGTGGTSFTAGTGCSLFSTTSTVRCGVSDTTRLRFTTNDREDLIDASRTQTPLDASVPEIFDTKGGDDTLVAGPLADEVRAGDGRDSITGGPGADALDGGAGDDVVAGLSPGDVVDGGDGTDTLDLSGETEGMSISLNGFADDGPPGSDANVFGIERVLGTGRADVIAGGEADDRLEGGEGNDTIDARGGGADVVDCGPGTGDVATVDETDEATGCERVELPQAGGGAAAPPAEPAPPVVDRDRDRDGVVAGVDCDDTRAGVRPGVRDVPGNRVDEDCSGADADAALVSGRLSFEFTAFANGTTKATRLVVRELARGGRVELRCKGRCKFRKRVGKPRRGSVNLLRLVRGRLRAGSTLEVRITGPDAIGRVVRFRMRNGKLPKRTTLCLPPGRGSAPSRCA